MAGSGDSGRMRSVRVECYVRGYHVYQRIWNPFVGEVAIAVREERNTHDRYAVAILEEDTCCSVGHLPREISKECVYFLKMGGTIKGPRLGFLLGGSAEGVQRIGSGSSTCSKKLVILAAIALEHSSQIFSHARASFGHVF